MRWITIKSNKDYPPHYANVFIRRIGHEGGGYARWDGMRKVFLNTYLFGPQGGKPEEFEWLDESPESPSPSLTEAAEAYANGFIPEVRGQRYEGFKDGWNARDSRPLWIKASKHPLEFEVVTIQQLINYGVNNGANIVNGMPWSFHYKGLSVTHENDNCYLVGTEGVKCEEKNPTIIFNGNAYSYWGSKLKVHIKHKGIPKILACVEGNWCFYREGFGSHMGVRDSDWLNIEYLNEHETQPQGALLTREVFNKIWKAAEQKAIATQEHAQDFITWGEWDKIPDDDTIFNSLNH